MKVVLRHTISGRYYRSPGNWVRRADNALAFENVCLAQEFSRLHNILRTQPVERLAPYLIPLLQRPPTSVWDTWVRSDGTNGHADDAIRFTRN